MYPDSEIASKKDATLANYQIVKEQNAANETTLVSLAATAVDGLKRKRKPSFAAASNHPAALPRNHQQLTT